MSPLKRELLSLLLSSFLLAITLYWRSAERKKGGTSVTWHAAYDSGWQANKLFRIVLWLARCRSIIVTWLDRIELSEWNGCSWDETDCIPDALSLSLSDADASAKCRLLTPRFHLQASCCITPLVDVLTSGRIFRGALTLWCCMWSGVIGIDPTSNWDMFSKFKLSSSCIWYSNSLNAFCISIVFNEMCIEI